MAAMLPNGLPITAPLRAARDRLREKVAAVADRVGELPALPNEERAAAMERVAVDLDTCLRPHLEWEERIIHPVVDKFASEGPAAFSASMRYEHQIIYRCIGELGGRAADAAALTAFSRRADNLIGLVLAHFELEEEVLFPILDRAFHRTSQDPVAAPPQD
jgi:hypothetical protein